jgi:hypothetical protein
MTSNEVDPCFSEVHRNTASTFVAEVLPETKRDVLAVYTGYDGC